MEKIWLKHYLPDVPHTIETELYASLIEWLDQSAHRYADRIAFDQLGVELSYSQVYERSIWMAAYLQTTFQLKKGDRFAIMLPNSLQYVIALLAALRLGLVVVNINPLYTPRELETQLGDSEAVGIIVLSHFAHTLEKALPRTVIQHVIVTDIADIFVQPKRFFVQLFMQLIKRQIPPFRLKHVRFLEVLEQGRLLKFKQPPIALDDLAFLQYTGGTTGTPKGAMLSHRNMVANVLQCTSWVRPALREGHERAVVALPLYHIFSLTVCGLSFWSMGAKGILVPNPRDIVGFVRTLKRTKPTVLVGINTLFNALLNHVDFQHLDFSDLKLSISGGMALQKTVAHQWSQCVGDHILEGYGLTEASPVICINSVKNPRYTGSIGFPISSTDISIRDDEGKELGIGETGELWVKGPQVMQGYWKQPEETSKVLTREGWLKTGDMAYVDEQGLVCIVDRKKDMILVSGFNVYPNEVEEVLVSHPKIQEAGVIGVKDGKGSETVKAFVVVTSKDLTVKAIQAYCKQRLTAYKVPKVFEFRDELPKSPVGKVLRKELR